MIPVISSRAARCFGICLAAVTLAHAGTVTISPANLAFGNQVLSTPSAVKTVTVSNGQSKALTITSLTSSLSDYTQSNNCPLSPATLAAGASCTVSVTFTPSALGSRAATLSINDDASNSPQKVTLSGTGIAAVTAAPASVSFANVTVGKRSASKTVTVKNNQTSSLTINSITVGLIDYTYTSACPLTPNTLGAGATCTISVFFTPTTTGVRSSTLTVSTSAGSPAVSLSGTGIQPVSVNPGSLTFAGQALGTTSAGQTVTLTNNQSTTLKITSITRSLTDFAYTTSCPLSPSTLGPGASCSATVTFSPQAVGTRSGTLSFNDNASNTPQTVSLSGTGTAATLVSIAVTPANPSLAAGLTQQLTATGTYSDGTSQDLMSLVTWTSSSPAIATVSSSGLATGSSQGTATITATSGSVGGSTSITVTAPNLVSIAITPQTPNLALGTTLQLVATGTYTDGSTLVLTNSVTWSSSNSAVATVSAQGLASSVSVGSTTVTAALSGVTGSTTANVTPATLVSIAITPAVPSIALGSSQQFTATGTYSNATTQDITAIVTWSSSLSSVATISNSPGSQGLTTSVAIGSTSITAASGTVSGNTTLTVAPAALVSIAVSPATPSIALGTSQQFAATGTYTDGSTLDLTSTAIWNSDAPAVAGINSAGFATSTSVGSANISATSGAIAGSTVLTITAAQLVSVAVSPATGTIPAGTTQQFTALGTYSDGTTQDLTIIGHWSSSDGTVATVSNSSGSQGLVSALIAGNCTITLTSGTVTGSAGLTVSAAGLASIAISPQAPSIALGLSQQFVATGTYTDNTTRDITAVVTWTSSSTAVAVISNSLGSNGLATSAASGTATITAASASISSYTTLTVTGTTLVSISVTPANASVAVGSVIQYVATGTYSDNTTQDLTTSVAWTSSNPAVGNISNSAGSQGFATGMSPGVATVSATSGSISGSAVLTVLNPASLVSIAVTPVSASVVVGLTQQFSATGTYSDGTTQDLTASATWTSSSPTIATVNGAGLSTGVATGSTTITAVSSSVAGSATLTVAPVALVSLKVTPSIITLTLGRTQQFTATGTYNNGTTQDLSNSVSWSSDGVAATITPTGLGTAATLGSAIITASSGSISGTASLISILAGAPTAYPVSNCLAP